MQARFDSEILSPLTQHEVTVFASEPQVSIGQVCQDMLAAEVPVALVFNDVSHAVMMATPQDLESFALGFALSEGIVLNRGEVRGIDVKMANAAHAGLPPGVSAIEVHLEVSSRSFEQLKTRRRAMAGRTGCGVCGVESLGALDLLGEPVAPTDWVHRVDAPLVLRAFSRLQKRQPLNAKSGALHAAGWATLDGSLVHVFEDVGRHNALDKLVGTLAKTDMLGTPGFVILSSRASHELVRKCARVGIAALATISAPTSMGVHMAELSGVRLWGLCREPRAVLYAPGAMTVSSLDSP